MNKSPIKKKPVFKPSTRLAYFLTADLECSAEKHAAVCKIYNYKRYGISAKFFYLFRKISETIDSFVVTAFSTMNHPV